MVPWVKREKEKFLEASRLQPKMFLLLLDRLRSFKLGKLFQVLQREIPMAWGTTTDS